MKLLVFLVIAMGCFNPLLSYHIPIAKVELLQPKGLKVSIPHEEGIESFSFIGSLNNLISESGKGVLYGEVPHQTNGFWTFYDENANLNNGDQLTYWLFVQKDKKKYRTAIIDNSRVKNPGLTNTPEHQGSFSISELLNLYAPLPSIQPLTSQPSLQPLQPLPQLPNFQSIPTPEPLKPGQFFPNQQQINPFEGFKPIQFLHQFQPLQPIQPLQSFQPVQPLKPLELTLQYQIAALQDQNSKLDEELNKRMLNTLKEIQETFSNINQQISTNTKLLIKFNGMSTPANIQEFVQSLFVNNLGLPDLHKDVISTHQNPKGNGYIIELKKPNEKQLVLTKANELLKTPDYNIEEYNDLEGVDLYESEDGLIDKIDVRFGAD